MKQSHRFSQPAALTATDLTSHPLKSSFFATPKVADFFVILLNCSAAWPYLYPARQDLPDFSELLVQHGAKKF